MRLVSLLRLRSVFIPGSFTHYLPGTTRGVLLIQIRICRTLKAQKMPRQVPSDLLWTLVRDNSSFIKKQKNIPVFTSEPNNLTGLNSFKFSGLANKKAAGLKIVKKGKKESVVLTQKLGAKQSSLSTGVKKCAKKGAQQLESLLSKAGFRRDLVPAAQKKYLAALKSFKKAKVQKQNQRIVARKAAVAAAAEEN
ncbi:unnamed protein product [Amoebophrya sp. A25]|nr:unnamed protein product [Amoebophrya sp. A25]|eukprot:GSA25T00008644001.1